MASRKPKTSTTAPAIPAPNLIFVSLANIQTVPQVRTEFNEDSIAELAESLKAHGMLQPVILRPQEGKDGTYLVIAGERRVRAAAVAGFTTVPAIVGAADDETAATMQLIENIQREELSLRDTAAGVLALYEKHQALKPVAAIVQKSLPWVSKHLTVATKLSHQAQDLLTRGVTEDLELLMTVSQIANLSNAFPRLDKLLDKIEAKKGGRKEARELLNTLRAEIDQAKQDRKGLKPGQQPLLEGEGATGQPGAGQADEVSTAERALADLVDVLHDSDHAPTLELLKAIPEAQQKDMANMPQHRNSHALGKKLQGATPAKQMRSLARLMMTGEISDPLDVAAFILGTSDVKLNLHDLAQEVHFIIHNQD